MPISTPTTPLPSVSPALDTQALASDRKALMSFVASVQPNVASAGDGSVQRAFVGRYTPLAKAAKGLNGLLVADGLDQHLEERRVEVCLVGVEGGPLPEAL